MKNNYTRVILSIIALLIIAGFIAYTFVVSPSKSLYLNGELQQKHKALESDCANCHTPFKGVSTASCTACHNEKGPQTDMSSASAKSMMHGSADCLDCHKEHLGRAHNAKLVGDKSCLTCHGTDPHEGAGPVGAVDKSERGISFPHDMHAMMGIVSEDACTTCHGDSTDDTPARMTLTAKYSDTCVTCHALDDHGFGTSDYEQCNKCHTNGIFGRTPQAEPKSAYSHALHSALKCAECHSGVMEPSDDAEVAIKTRPTVPDCMSCHSEKLVNNDCATCHSYHK